MKTLIIAGHPDLENSIVNKTILEEVANALPEAKIRRLCEVAPDGRFDIAAEQKELLEADLIVWQFPFWWYNLPWLMKKWVDEVFVHGFAHGSKGVLGGKKLLVSFTTGAPEEAYTGLEGSLADINHLAEAFSATAALCKLDYKGAMWLNGVSYAARGDTAAIASQESKATGYAARLVERIKSIAG